MKNKAFTDQELKEMGTLTLDLLTEAIEAGDKDRAKNLAKRMYQESLKMHDMYVDWTAGLMDWIYKNGGDDSLEKAMRKVLTDFTQNMGKMPDMRKVDFRLRVQGTVNSLRGHQQPLKLVEDDEKVCITMQPCGSGEKLFQKGRFGPPCNHSLIQKPQPMTAGKTDFPVYCTHDPIFEMLSIEQHGYPVTVCYFPEKVAREGSCGFCIYKDFKDIPEEVWTRVGKQKPKDL
jgi:hypothetical protein